MSARKGSSFKRETASELAVVAQFILPCRSTFLLLRSPHVGRISGHEHKARAHRCHPNQGAGAKEDEHAALHAQAFVSRVVETDSEKNTKQRR